jgi:hypothetical protein
MVKVGYLHPEFEKQSILSVAYDQTIDFRPKTRGAKTNPLGNT